MTEANITPGNKKTISLSRAFLLTALLGITYAAGSTIFTYQKTPEELAVLTYELRQNAKMLYLLAGVPNKDVTESLVAIKGPIATDRRSDVYMEKLSVDDGYPYEDKPKRILRHGHEVHVVGRDGEFYVEFHGTDPNQCNGIKFAVCAKD